MCRHMVHGDTLPLKAQPASRPPFVWHAGHMLRTQPELFPWFSQ